MNRPIKFRVWNPRKREYSDGCWMYQSGKLDHDSIENWELQNCVVEQFTGLLDSQGNEIYEGDIVKCKNNRIKDEMGAVTYGKFSSSHEAGFSRGHIHMGFYIEKNKKVLYDCADEDIEWTDVVIVGNIHQNPELLAA